MKTSSNKRTHGLTEEMIDDIVTGHSDDDSAWTAPVRVKKPKVVSLTISGDLAARAAFLVKLHRQARVEQWVEQVVRERVELEELAFTEAKKKLAS